MLSMGNKRQAIRKRGSASISWSVLINSSAALLLNRHWSTSTASTSRSTPVAYTHAYSVKARHHELQSTLAKVSPWPHMLKSSQR